MIEIFVLAKYCKRLAAIVREKNRSRWWAALGAVGWIGGEITGLVIASRGDGDTTNLYATGLLCGLIGALVAYVIVQSLASAKAESSFPTARVV